MKSNKKGKSYPRNKKMHYKPKSRLNQLLDLNEIEEASDRSFFLKVGENAAKNAVNENKALRIPITFYLDNWIVRRMPAGDIQKISEVKISNKITRRRIAKGTILHVKRSRA